MSDESFEVVSYSIEDLLHLLARESETSKEDVEDKHHSAYFKDYFDEIGASTVVVEPNYMDHDFLEDFARYYVKCFASYRRFCTRLHFFSLKFSAEDFSSLFLGVQSPISFSDLDEAYLGFMIVKPIPDTLVGRTCLVCYPSDNGRRHYPTTRSYEAHLFGHTLTVSTLAFQEQDTVVAACATSALWSTFHATGKLFQHSIPSPVEITEAAQVAYDVETRAFPNEGLTLSQMAQSIRSVSLEPRLINVENETHILKANIYAYVKGGFHCC